MIDSNQVGFYRENGYLILPGLLAPAVLEQLQATLFGWAAEGEQQPASSNRFDLGPALEGTDNELRRIRDPHRYSADIAALATGPLFLDVLEALLGPDIRFDGSKVNVKGPGCRAPVGWHQDLAFFPATNDDMLTLTVLIEDSHEGNAPLMVVPGSHRGPLHDHHYRGEFVGLVDTDGLGVDLSTAVPLTGPAGTVLVHHYRLLHGSDRNRSAEGRMQLFFRYAAADAWPLLGSMECRGGFDFGDFAKRIVRGQLPSSPRMTGVPLKIPAPVPAERDVLFKIQAAFPAERLQF